MLNIINPIKIQIERIVRHNPIKILLQKIRVFLAFSNDLEDLEFLLVFREMPVHDFHSLPVICAEIFRAKKLFRVERSKRRSRPDEFY